MISPLLRPAAAKKLHPNKEAGLQKLLKCEMGFVMTADSSQPTLIKRKLSHLLLQSQDKVVESG